MSQPAVGSGRDVGSDPRAGSGGPGAHRAGAGKRKWYLLLAVQYVLALCVPFYNAAEPALAGVPFFYWYQLLMVLVCAVLTAIVYFVTEH
ncbi:MAG TPA: DUF3311 domain-containing protein [Burkholderiaceae bacterium]|nr:DUF3311 domain-containing protein [Burkholderiaceae bacterium]